MSSSDPSAETKRAFGWLAVALVFFAAILWWKSDKIFGGDTPDPPPAKVYKPIRSDDPNAPKIAVTVVDDKTSGPVANARVVIFSRSAEALGDELTSSSGTAEVRPKKAKFRGVVAWHKGYEIRCALVTSGPIEIRLRPVTYLSVDIGILYPARKAWFSVSNSGLTFKYNRSSVNPMKAKEDYLEFKMCEHLGLRNKKWPLDSNPIRIPRYLLLQGKLRLVTDSKWPNHLETRGMRDTDPPSLTGSRTESDPFEAYTNVQSVTMKAPPDSPHALVGRYRRRKEDKGVLMVHLRQLGRDPMSPNYGDPITADSEFSTYEEDGGTATFRAFGLHKTIVYPTVLVFPPSGPRKTIRCNPVEIDGLTEVELKPLEYGKLTIRTVNGGLDIQLLDDHLEPLINAGPETRDGGAQHWSRIEPTVYRAVSQTKTHSTPLLVVRIAPGEHKIVDTKLLPACRVTLVYKKANGPEAILVRDKATGAEHRFEEVLFPRHFNIKVEGEGDATILRLTGLRHELFLPHGEYEFVRVEKGGAKGRVILVTIKGTIQDVSLD